MKARAGVLLSLLLVGASLPLPALDLTSGKVKLTLFEGIGRFSVSCQGAGGTWIPLLSPQDPRTTMLSVVVDSRILRMGEAAGFSEAVEKTRSGARFVWKSDFLIVTETFSFVSSVGAAAPDGIRIDLALQNVSRQDFTIGVRYLFDTWLGEAGPAHFTTDAGLTLKRETQLSSHDLPRWWVSPRPGDSDQLGLQCMVTQDGVTLPDRIVFANWKRLSDAAWAYETSSVRDFNLLPYSKNDSAVAQYYNPRPLAQGGQYTVTLVLGRYNPAGFPAVAPAPVVRAADLTGAAQQSPGGGDAPAALQADLDAVDAVLSRINEALASGADISDADLALMESTIKDLSARSATNAK